MKWSEHKQCSLDVYGEGYKIANLGYYTDAIYHIVWAGEVINVMSSLLETKSRFCVDHVTSRSRTGCQHFRNVHRDIRAIHPNDMSLPMYQHIYNIFTFV